MALPSLHITKEVDDEIDRMYEGSQAESEAAADIDLLIELLHEDSGLLDDLSISGDHYLVAPPFQNYRYEAAIAECLNIIVIKMRDDFGSLHGYRLMLGYHGQKNTYYALAVFPRGRAYTARQRGILAHRYDECGIPRLPPIR